MATRLESVSGRHLLIFFLVLTICQIIWFSIGSIAPYPTRTNYWLYDHKEVVCLTSEVNDTWLYDGSCNQNSTESYYDQRNGQSNSINWNNASSIDIGFQFEYVHAFQEKLTVLLMSIFTWDSENYCNLTTDFTIQAKLGYRSRYDETDWHLLATSATNHSLNCYTSFSGQKNRCSYWCKNLPVFELQSLNYFWYLLNIRISTTNEGSLNLFKNADVNYIQGSPDFTQLWWSMKTIFTAVIFVAILWFWKQMKKVSRKASLLERMILILACTLQLYNIPLEWMTLLFEVPFFQTINGFRKDILYVTLMIFWLIFTKEHIQDSGNALNTFRSYWISITLITLGCIVSFTPDLVDSAFHSVNPFYTLWSTYFAITLELVYVILISILAFVYLFFLMWTIRKVYTNPYTKSLFAVRRLEPELPTESPEISERYQCCSMFNGLIEISLSSNPSMTFPAVSLGYRHISIALLTGLCATLTVIDLVVRRVTTDQWKWNGNTGSYMPVSEFYTGVYGLWNVYAVALMYLYSPVHRMESNGIENREHDSEQNKFCSDDDDEPCC